MTSSKHATAWCRDTSPALEHWAKTKSKLKKRCSTLCPTSVISAWMDKMRNYLPAAQVRKQSKKARSIEKRQRAEREREERELIRWGQRFKLCLQQHRLNKHNEDQVNNCCAHSGSTKSGRTTCWKAAVWRMLHWSRLNDDVFLRFCSEPAVGALRDVLMGF